MLDIAVIIILCALNAKTVKAKGRKAAGIVAATIGLCFAFAFCFVLIVVLLKHMPISSISVVESWVEQNFLAIVVADYSGIAVGGVISFFLARKDKTGDAAGRNDYYRQNPGQNDPYNQNPYGQNQYHQGQNNQNPYSHGPRGQNPYNQDPRGQNPYNQDPRGQNPYNQNPYNQNPYGQNPYNQNPFNQNQAGQNDPGQVYQNGAGMQQNGQQNGQTYQENGYAHIPFGGQPMADGVRLDPNDPNVLASPCTICIVRERASEGGNGIYTFSLNGHPACRLVNGTCASLMTLLARNTVTARDASGMSLKYPITFMAAAGGYVEIHVKGSQFLPRKTIGRRPANPQDTVPHS